ncbi:MAG: endonuclease domain-containing protein [Alphaproteobacteria bacterium]|nr:endonuclease domain-containing protein [Alphaproteobacteria bacterium]
MTEAKKLRPRTKIARSLRRRETEAEKRLWWALRHHVTGYRFRRQHPIGRFIVDFACPACKLVIEIHGSQHMTNDEADARRTGELAGAGYRVIRFWSNEVLTNTVGVVEAIRNHLDGSCREIPLRPSGRRGWPSTQREAG